VGGKPLLILLSPCLYSITKAFFDPEQSKYCRDEGFVDISPYADGGVLKKVIKEGSAGSKFIEEGCPTFGKRVSFISVMDRS
jgi:hypothetical protein